MVGHVPTGQSLLPHPLFLCCSTCCSHFSPQLAWGTPGVPAASVGSSLSFPGFPQHDGHQEYGHTPGTCIHTTAAERMGTQASQQTFAMRRDGLPDVIRNMGRCRKGQGASSSPRWNTAQGSWPAARLVKSAVREERSPWSLKEQLP